MEIYLCVSQNEIKTPYKFKITNINVYSMEEAAYHLFTYWKQSYDEFLSKDFLEWVRNSVKQPFWASQISTLKEKENMSDRIIGFLSLFDHFDSIQLATLKGHLISWEQRMEWERLKDKADYLTEKNQSQKAINIYLKALDFEKNQQLLNNIAICYMKLSSFKEAINYLEQALLLDENNIDIMLNLAEACIYNHDFQKALDIITRAEQLDFENPDIKYLIGELNNETGNIIDAIDYFLEALELKYDEHYIFRLYETYKKCRKYDEALDILEKIKDKNKNYLSKKSEAYMLNNNIPAAIKAIEKAIDINKNDEVLWAMLAKYHRLDYNLDMAENAILNAISLNENLEMVKKERALIKKAQGKTKEYQLELNGILTNFKNKYRNRDNIIITE